MHKPLTVWHVRQTIRRPRANRCERRAEGSLVWPCPYRNGWLGRVNLALGLLPTLTKVSLSLSRSLGALACICEFRKSERSLARFPLPRRVSHTPSLFSLFRVSCYATHKRKEGRKAPRRRKDFFRSFCSPLPSFFARSPTFLPRFSPSTPKFSSFFFFSDDS